MANACHYTFWLRSDKKMKAASKENRLVFFSYLHLLIKRQGNTFSYKNENLQIGKYVTGMKVTNG